MPPPRDPKALHAEFKELKKTNPMAAKPLKRDNPGIGCVWAKPNIPNVNMILIDPDTGRCVRDQFGDLVTSPPGMTQAPKKGVNPPPAENVASGPSQNLLIEGASLCSAVKPTSACAQLAKQNGFKIVLRGRKVKINGPTPITITVEQAQKLGILPRQRVELMKLETWFDKLELEKVGWAAVQPIPDAFADVIEGFFVLSDRAFKARRRHVIKVIQSIKNAANWPALRSRQSQRSGVTRAIGAFGKADRGALEALLNTIRDTKAPPKAVHQEISGNTAKITLNHADDYRAPDAFAGEPITVTLPAAESSLKPTSAINWLRNVHRTYGNVTRQQLNEHPVLSNVYLTSQVIRDSILIFSGGMPGVAAVAFLSFMGAMVKNRDQDDDLLFIMQVARDTLLGFTKAKLLKRIQDITDYKALGKTVEVAVEVIAEKFMSWFDKFIEFLSENFDDNFVDQGVRTK
jgi:hypothetical protein